MNINFLIFFLKTRISTHNGAFDEQASSIKRYQIVLCNAKIVLWLSMIWIIKYTTLRNNPSGNLESSFLRLSSVAYMVKIVYFYAKHYSKMHARFDEKYIDTFFIQISIEPQKNQISFYGCPYSVNYVRGELWTLKV